MNIKLTIKNISNEVLQTCIFHEQETLDAFVEMIASNFTFGKPEHSIYIPAVLNDYGEELSPESTEVIPSEYIIEQEDITAQIDEQTRKDTLKAAGLKARLACQTVLDLISGHNLSANLTANQITTMAQTFGTLLQALTISRPGAAKLLINVIIPDGILITDQMKQDCLDELVDY